MRRCKCQICKKELNTDIAYKVFSGGKNKYYCSSKEYMEMIVEDNYKNSFINLCYELLDARFNDNGKFLNSKIKEIKQGYSYKEMYDTLNKCSLDVQFALMDIEPSGKVPYMFAIIKNRLYSGEKYYVKHEQVKEIAADVVEVQEIEHDDYDKERLMQEHIKVMAEREKNKNKPQHIQYEDIDLDF